MIKDESGLQLQVVEEEEGCTRNYEKKIHIYKGIMKESLWKCQKID